MSDDLQLSVKLLRRIKAVLDVLMANPMTHAEIRLNELYDHLRRDPQIHAAMPTSRATSQFLRSMHQQGLMKQVIPNYRVDTFTHEMYQWYFFRDTGKMALTSSAIPAPSAAEEEVADEVELFPIALDAAGFLRLWRSFVTLNGLDKQWEARNWTELTIGAPTSEGAGSPFGEYVVGRFAPVACRYWKEDRGYDLVLSLTPLHSVATPPEGWKDFYPAVPDVVVEQELSPLTSWMEMGKLIRTRAKLKVLLTYTEDPDVETRSVDQFTRMINEANAHWGEDPRTTYLLIVGSKPAQDPVWKAWTFSGSAIGPQVLGS
jgi:hypothetical protein